MSHLRHFLDLDHLDAATLRDILTRGADLKARRRRAEGERPLLGKSLAMIFEKPSTRTRVSFEVGIRELGGEAVILTAADTQLGRGETIADTARVLSRYVDAIVLRTNSSQKLAELAHYATVPVINGLTDRSHPCQVMADVMTFEEHRGPIAGRLVAWSGDANNVASSWVHAAARFGFALRIACPEALQPAPEILAWAKSERADIRVTTDPREAVAGADCVVTDTWLSMANEEAAPKTRGNGELHRRKRHNLLTPYQVDEELMRQAKPEALFMHCLPAHRGEEVSEGVIDGPQSVVWDEAENRLHVQKGILTWCMT